MKLIVGLGNPGQQYHMTRHNIGFFAVKQWLPPDAIGPKKICDSLLWTCVHAGVSIKVILPQTYMNNAGVAVQKIMNYFKITASDTVIIYDDFELPFGTVRVRHMGSAGTHNGMRSVIQHSGTQAINRIRIGIGPKPAAIRTDSFVLSKFSTDEQSQLVAYSPRISQIITYVCCGALQQAQQVRLVD